MALRQIALTPRAVRAICRGDHCKGRQGYRLVRFEESIDGGPREVFRVLSLVDNGVTKLGH